MLDIHNTALFKHHTGALKLQDWTMEDWILTDWTMADWTLTDWTVDIAGLDIARLDNDGRMCGQVTKLKLQK